MTFTNDRGISYELQTLFIAPIPVNVFCIKQKRVVHIEMHAINSWYRVLGTNSVKEDVLDGGI